jgi:hypothetical protein
MKRALFVFFAVLAVGLSTAVPAFANTELGQSRVPPELRVPDGYKRVLQSVGRGVQIYDCVDSAWKFREPAAAILTEWTERVVALHYVGPTWQSIRDGSKVVAAVKARKDAPSATFPGCCWNRRATAVLACSPT